MSKNIDTSSFDTCYQSLLPTMTFNVLLVGAGEINFGASYSSCRRPGAPITALDCQGSVEGPWNHVRVLSTVPTLSLIDYAFIDQSRRLERFDLFSLAGLMCTIQLQQTRCRTSHRWSCRSRPSSCRCRSGKQTGIGRCSCIRLLHVIHHHRRGCCRPLSRTSSSVRTLYQ